ncbi:hypothetical protein [Moorena sp. SIO3H5]|uniref:hypothetical protein n=1 Tax=Moorena sp. SIO3H5 TaxID=2607834 RepID=UPI0013BAD358|nr:hypothetical protein [Moorena sp. SIO3H5]NEO73672.1 hypothetical protein [Moorena sp. SIO3H5]
MSTIKIAELRPAGSELFQDSESFLNELSDGQEMNMVLGGFSGFPFSFGTFQTVQSVQSIDTASIVSNSVVTGNSVVSVNSNVGGKGKKKH